MLTAQTISEEKYIISPELKTAIEQVHLLKNNVLVIRLVSFQRQIDYYNQNLKQNPTDTEKKLMTKKLTYIESYRDAMNRSIVSAVKEEYHFSEYRFIYDINYSKSDTSKNNRYFLDDSLKINTKLAIGDRPFLVFGKMDQLTDSGNSRENFYLTTPDLIKVNKPMPRKVGDLFFDLELDYNKNQSASEFDSCKTIFNKLNKRLNRFNSQVIEWRNTGKLN